MEQRRLITWVIFSAQNLHFLGNFHRVATAVMAAGILAGFAPVFATDSPEEVQSTKNKPSVRGGIVFRAYCILCHGERADGMSRGSKLYGALNLDLKSNSRDYIEKIIRDGGKAVGKTDFMPSWKDELSDEQINDVVEYVTLVKNQVSRGEVVFKTNCILCHGVKGDGKGRASVLFDPPPANLTQSDKNDEYKKMIITLGGKAMGRSEVMPIWGEQLTEQQIDDVVAYLRTILVKSAVE
jgi:cytochrome c oxidase cbb3-type subunit 3